METREKHILPEAEKLVEILIRQGRTVTFAESCTAGLCAAALVDVPNASRVFNESYVTYAYGSKEKLLGVSHESVEKFGVVSEQVAGEMAKGAAEKSGSELAAGISGIAGPGGGTPEKPVGTVCFGFFVNGSLFVCTRHFGAIGRREVREATVRFALQELCRLAEEEKGENKERADSL